MLSEVPEIEKIKYRVNAILVIPINSIKVSYSDENHPRYGYKVDILNKPGDFHSLDFSALKKLSKKYYIFSIYWHIWGFSIHMRKKEFLDYLFWWIN